MRHQNDTGSHKPLSLVRVTSVVIICLAVLLSVAAILYGEGGSMFSSSSEDVVQVTAPVGKLSEPVRLTGRNQCIVWHAGMSRSVLNFAKQASLGFEVKLRS